MYEEKIISILKNTLFFGTGHQLLHIIKRYENPWNANFLR